MITHQLVVVVERASPHSSCSSWTWQAWPWWQQWRGMLIVSVGLGRCLTPRLLGLPAGGQCCRSVSLSVNLRCHPASGKVVVALYIGSCGKACRFFCCRLSAWSHPVCMKQACLLGYQLMIGMYVTNELGYQLVAGRNHSSTTDTTTGALLATEHMLLLAVQPVS